MGNFELDEERDHWTGVLFAFSDDKVATCHLLFSLMVQNQLKGVKRDKQNPFVLIYLKNAITYVLDSIKVEKPEQTSYDQTIATFAWEQMFDLIMESPSKNSLLENRLYLQGVKMILENYEEIVAHKTFREYFDDITINERGRIASEKASKLISEYIVKAQTDEHFTLVKDDIEDEDDEYSDFPPYYYMEQWEESKHLLEEMPMENALLFHITSLLLCRKSEIEPKIYSKYQKAVLKAFSAVKDGSNQHQKEFLLGNADEAFEKMKERLHRNIEKGYEEESLEENPEISREEIYTLASDLCLTKVSELDSFIVDQTLKELSLNSENFYTCEEVELYCHEFSTEANAQLDDIVGEYYAYDQYDDEEYQEEETEDGEEPYNGMDSEFESDEKGDAFLSEKTKEELKSHIESTLGSLDLPRAIFFHVVYLNILASKRIHAALYADYSQAVKIAVKAYNGEGDTAYKESTRKNTDKVFLETISNIIDKVGIKKGDTPEQAIDAFVYLFVVNASVTALSDIPTIYADAIEKSLPQLDYDEDRDDFYEVATDAYSLKYLTITSNGILYDFIKSMPKVIDK